MRPAAASGVVVVSAIAAVERWSRRTRATASERRRRLPGDDLVPDPLWQATRAVTIDAAPDDVWPWLVQMGFPTKRAGWYTPFWLDRILFGVRSRSATRVVPELQQLAVGDRVDDSDSGRSYFEVAELDRPHALVLLSHTHPLPAYEDVDFSWAFVLDDARPTRLIVRARVRYQPVWPPWIVRTLVVVGFGIGDLVQAGAMLLGIRSRVALCTGRSCGKPRMG